MNRRTKSLWLPAMVNLVLSAALLVLFDKLGFQPRIAPVSHIALAFQPWIFALPLCGAVGALLARRAEGSRGARLIAGLAPSLVWLAVFSILGLVFACDRRDFAGFPLDSVALAAVGWVVLPALALLAGTAPFLGEDSRAGCRL